ncbi:Ran GTPase-activating protein 1 [Nematocida sp. AWRm80]|nr:Ran GTPase-activating protein 1 [Nematocida sp. AWRm80]
MRIISISEEKKKYDTVEEVEELLERLREEKSEIYGVDLTENSFSFEALQVVLKEISTMPQLKLLILRGIFTQRLKEEVEKSLREIVATVDSLKELEYFDISDNALSMHGMNILVPMIENMESIKRLVLNNNGIGRDGGEALGNALEELSKKSDQLQSIEIGRNRLEDSAEKIGKSLKLFPYLDAVKIYQNSITSVCMGDFLLSIKDLQIRILDISDNFLLEHGSIIIATCINNWNIETLNISDCIVGETGFKSLVDHLETKTKVQGEFAPEREINLAYNEISSECLETIQSLQSKLSPTRFIFTGNELTQEDITAITKTANQTANEIVFEDEDDESIFSSDLLYDEKTDSSDIEELEKELAEISLHPEDPNAQINTS